MFARKPNQSRQSVNLGGADSRRGFLKSTGTVLASTLTTLGLSGQVLAADSKRQTSKESGVLLVADANHTKFRVRMEMEVNGNVDIASNPLVSRKRSLQLPLECKAKFDYEERYRSPNEQNGLKRSADEAVTYIERFYHEASSESDVNRSSNKNELRPLVRETVVRRETLPEVIYATEDYLSRDELELLRVPVSSVAVDALLPKTRVKQGAKYRPDQESLASVLNLTSVDATDIQAEVVSLNSKEAKIQLRGQAEGSVDGVPTGLKIVGKLTFNRTVGACTWLAVAIHETRDIGIAEPGFDVSATVRMVRKPVERVVGLPSKLTQAAVAKAIPRDRLYVDLHSDSIRFAALMNRQWRMMRDVPGTSMMRMIRDDRSIAQCDFRTLPSLEAGKQWTLEAFAKDVKRTLGDQLSDLVSADQQLSPAGLRVLRVTAAGAVEGVPIQWVLMHFSDDSGRRMLATFTLESDQIENFAGSDLQLASSMRFVGSSGQGEEAVTMDQKGSGDKNAKVTKSDEPRVSELQSVIDVK